MMGAWIDYFLFGIYPYIALTVCVLGCWARFDRSQYSWRAGSTEIVEKRTLSWASPLFHAGVICILLGHAAGFLAPPRIEKALGITPSMHLLIASTAGGLFAVPAAIGGAGLLWRRLANRTVKGMSNPTDSLILAMLYFQLWLGIAGLPHSFHFAIGYPDAPTTTMDLWGEWCRGGLLLHPGIAKIVQDLPWLYKLHVLNGLTIVLLVPFTRLAHILSAPVWYLFRPGYQIVRSAKHISSGTP